MAYKPCNSSIFYSTFKDVANKDLNTTYIIGYIKWNPLYFTFNDVANKDLNTTYFIGYIKWNPLKNLSNVVLTIFQWVLYYIT